MPKKPRKSGRPAVTPPARIQVLASAEQAKILAEAAAQAGSDRSSWMLAHSLRAAAEDQADGPVTLGRHVSDRLRAAAERQGISPENLVEQLLMAAA
jgi:hypothetical protein